MLKFVFEVYLLGSAGPALMFTTSGSGKPKPADWTGRSVPCDVTLVI